METRRPGRGWRPVSNKLRRGQCGFTKLRPTGLRTHCQATATYKVGISLKSSKYDEPKHFFFDDKRIVCLTCSGKLSLDDMLTRSGWLKICAAFVSHGFKKPRRDLVGLVFERLRA